MISWKLLSLMWCAGGLAAASAEPAPTPVPAVFRAWMTTQRQTGDVRVAFNLTKTMPTLKQPVTSSGRFWSYADGRFLWETGKPATSVLRYNGTTLASWEASHNKWRQLDPNDRRMRVWMNFLSGRNLTEESLTKDFIISTPKSSGDTTTVLLEPRSARTRKDLASIELQIESADHRLLRLTINQGDGGTQQMDFEKPKRMTDADQAVVLPADREK